MRAIERPRLPTTSRCLTLHTSQSHRGEIVGLRVPGTCGPFRWRPSATRDEPHRSSHGARELLVVVGIRSGACAFVEAWRSTASVTRGASRPPKGLRPFPVQPLERLG